MNVKGHIITELFAFLVAAFDGFFWAFVFYLFGASFGNQIVVFCGAAIVTVWVLHYAIPCDCPEEVYVLYDPASPEKIIFLP